MGQVNILVVLNMFMALLHSEAGVPHLEGLEAV